MPLSGTDARVSTQLVKKDITLLKRYKHICVSKHTVSKVCLRSIVHVSSPAGHHLPTESVKTDYYRGIKIKKSAYLPRHH
ncbi:hypothetical protein CEXT_349771 [Caerostris extrusa]|uniref:Uncharacterized protein n=1 Tax=Caerostris extrusa TaxID=172846 RepID=A0AAV4QP69_CAEEX|nr:hypothetical protein CEXT_349771 [Caerostris extrusa]